MAGVVRRMIADNYDEPRQVGDGSAGRAARRLLSLLSRWKIGFQPLE